MFTLLSGLWAYLFRKDEFYILILGLDNAGKSTLLEQIQISFNKKYKAHDLKKITTTVGLNIGKVDRKGIRLNFWDLGGQAELQLLWDKYYSESHAIIYVVDSNDRARMDKSLESFEKMMRNKTLDHVPLLLIANKQDLTGCLSCDDVKALFAEHTKLLGTRDHRFIAASALKGSGIHDGIDWVIDHVKFNTEYRPAIVRTV